MTLGPLHLMRPEWLWALLPVALLALALVRARCRAGNWSAVIAPELLPYLAGDQADSRSNRALPWLVAAWLVAVVALCGPSLRKIPQPVQQRADALVVVLDLSYSMKARDLAPSRMDRARQKIVDLLDRRDEGQTALVAFAGDAHVVTPLTDDNPTIANLLPALNPDMMPLPGSDTAAGIDLALDLLRSGSAGGGRILLLTDGVAAGQREQIADAVRGAGVELVVMGVGTRDGAPLPLPDGGFLRDPDGSIVIPSLDESALARLAGEAGGRYQPLRIDASDLDSLAGPAALPGRERLTESGRRADHWQDQGYLLLLLLLPVAALLFRRGTLAALLLPLLLATEPRPAAAQVPVGERGNSAVAEGTAAESPLARHWNSLWLTPDQRGRRALERGDAGRARELFEDPAWAGTAAYREGDFEAAARDFGRGDSADDWYNRGNALARSGDLEGAIEAYRQSLEKAPGRSDASENLALVEKLKEQRDQQQQEQQNQQNQQNPDQQDGDEQDRNGDSGDSGDKGDTGNGGQRPPGEDARDGQSPSPGENETPPPGGNNQQPGDRQSTGTGNDPGESGERPEASPSAAREKDADDGEHRNTAPAAPSPEEAERNQAMEQWLRRVPDDPSGLLREKFRYESRQRQEQGEKPDNERYW